MCGSQTPTHHNANNAAFACPAQLMVLRNARLAGATKVTFEGRELPLMDHHVVITMNPGYSGRTELPNNLQVWNIYIATFKPGIKTSVISCAL